MKISAPTPRHKPSELWQTASGKRLTYQRKAPRPRDQLCLASHVSAQLALASSLRTVPPRQLCPNLFTRDLKSLEIFKTPKRNSHRKRNWEGQTVGTLADRNYIFFSRRNMLLPVWLLAGSAAENMPAIRTLHIPYSQTMTNRTGTAAAVAGIARTSGKRCWTRKASQVTRVQRSAQRRWLAAGEQTGAALRSQRRSGTRCAARAATLTRDRGEGCQRPCPKCAPLPAACAKHGHQKPGAETRR